MWNIQQVMPAVLKASNPIGIPDKYAKYDGFDYCKSCWIEFTRLDAYEQNVVNILSNAVDEKTKQKALKNLDKKHKKKRGVKGRKVKCVETGQVWNSRVACSKDLDCSSMHLGYVIKYGKVFKGMHWVDL